MRTAIVTAGAIVLAATLHADDRSINFDKAVDFSTFKTFVVPQGHVTSAQPELNTPLFVKQVDDAVRAALTAKGLTETADHPDLVVRDAVIGQDFSIGPAGRENPIPLGRAARSFEPVSFTEGTLVIDMTARGSGATVWHGVYRHEHSSAAKLVRQLPQDVGKLLSQFPPKKK